MIIEQEIAQERAKYELAVERLKQAQTELEAARRTNDFDFQYGFVVGVLCAGLFGLMIWSAT